MDFKGRNAMYTQKVQEIEGKSKVKDFYQKDVPKMFFLPAHFFSFTVCNVVLVWGGCVYTCINL